MSWGGGNTMDRRVLFITVIWNLSATFAVSNSFSLLSCWLSQEVVVFLSEGRAGGKENASSNLFFFFSPCDHRFGCSSSELEVLKFRFDRNYIFSYFQHLPPKFLIGKINMFALFVRRNSSIVQWTGTDCYPNISRHRRPLPGIWIDQKIWQSVGGFPHWRTVMCPNILLLEW